jgi:predicted esterase
LIDENTKALIFIDPSGNPEFPLRKYKDLFEEFSILGVCSWEIKNGPLANNLKLINTLINHIKKEYSIPEKNIIISGFSGGSRMASGYAAKHPGITKVIACGSGYAPGMNTISETIPTYIGVVGTLDMNLTEMITAYEKSAGFSSMHYLMMFPGIHEWPDNHYFKNAYILVVDERSEMKEKVLHEEEEKIRNLKRAGLIMEAYFNCQSLKNYYKENKIDQESICLESIDSSMAYSLLEEEKEEIYQFTNAFNLIRSKAQGFKVEKRTREWWRNRIMQIQKHINNSQYPRVIYKNKRLLAFISWNAYEYAMILINFEGKYKYANEFLEIWSMSAPESPMPYYVLARNYMRLNKIKKARHNLQEAQKRGIKDIQSIENDSLVAPIYHLRR